MKNPETRTESATYEYLQRAPQEVYEKLFRLQDRLIDIRRYYERNPDKPKAVEKIRYVEHLLSKISAVLQGALTVCLEKLDPFILKWEQRAEIIRREDPTVAEFEEVTKKQIYTPQFINEDMSKATYVDWGLKNIQSTSLSGALITVGMAPCCSLAIIDPRNNTQKLAHVYPEDHGTKKINSDMRPTDAHLLVREAVKDAVITSEARYYVIEGSHRDKNTAHLIYAMLRSAGVPQTQISFVPSRGNARNAIGAIKDENIVIRNGEVMRATDVVATMAQLQYIMKEVTMEVGVSGVQAIERSAKRLWPSAATVIEKYYYAKRRDATDREYYFLLNVDVGEWRRDLFKRIAEQPEVVKEIPNTTARTFAASRYVSCMAYLVALEPERYLHLQSSYSNERSRKP